MKLEADARIRFPRELVYRTYRDRLPELVPHLPNVKKITVQRREDDAGGPGVTRLLNLWEAKGDIPKVAQGVLKPEMLAWLDHATWNQGAWTCDWRIETRMFTENVRCGGHNEYVEDGDHTILKIRGELEMTLKGIPGVPSFLAGTVTPHVEKFIVSLLTPNLLSVAEGVERFLIAQGG
jgi:hypothetical protein